MLGEIPDISLIAGKEFRNWEVKDLDPFPDCPRKYNVKRRINIVLPFSHDSVTTARLKTYNVHLDIASHGDREEMG
ncbi:hypothetical protein TNCV_154271 [Trichonephila clavipes]|nr:hypothetical protein TNCV_154271 [Trichonephila clavipes]